MGIRETMDRRRQVLLTASDPVPTRAGSSDQLIETIAFPICGLIANNRSPLR